MLFYIYGLFTFLILLFSVIKKGVPVIVFCVLDFLYSASIAVLIVALTKETGDLFSPGSGVYLRLISNVLSFSFAIWLTAAKSSEKREKKLAELNRIDAQNTAAFAYAYANAQNMQGGQYNPVYNNAQGAAPARQYNPQNMQGAAPVRQYNPQTQGAAPVRQYNPQNAQQGAAPMRRSAPNANGQQGAAPVRQYNPTQNHNQNS